MNIRDCQYIIAVDESKNFARAAKKCFVSQPALSQQIKKIENELGVQIFERHHKNILTTYSGQQIINFAKEIIESFSQMKQIARDKKEIRISFIPTICSYLLPHIISAFEDESFNNSKFFFLEDNTDHLLNKLHKGFIDCGIITHFAEFIDDSIHYEKLYDEEFMLALPKDSNLHIHDFESIVQSKQLLLLQEGNCMSTNIQDICSTYSQSSYHDFYATSIETVKNMIRVKNGIGILPILSCYNDNTIKVQSFTPQKYREIGMVWRKNYFDPDIIINIRTKIAQYIKDISILNFNK